MTSMSRAAQRPAPADDPGAAEPEENGLAAAPLFDNYLSPDRPNPGAYDEMFSPDGSIRGPYRALHEAMAPTAAADLKVRSEALDRATSTRASRSRSRARSGRSRSTSCPG
jgi:hypothetical protein